MSELGLCGDFTCKHLDPGDSCKLVDFLIDDDSRMRKENTKLRLMLKNLVVGIGKELCDYADKQRCSECSMDHKNSYCMVTDAMEILEEDA